jgi:MoaA/NifB/PqqE/SkfB family radical SAM enzyme
MTKPTLLNFRNALRLVNVKRSRFLNIAPNSILFLLIWVTNKCHLRCQMCDQWKTEDEMVRKELSTQEWFSVIDSAARMHTAMISVTGGEPLLRPDLFDILSYINKRKIISHLCTSGTLLNKATIDKFKHSKLDSVSISIDSFRSDIHNEMRGVDCFKSVIRGVTLLREVLPKIRIGINFTITRNNFRDMHQMVPFAEALGVDQIKFAPIHTNLMHKAKNLGSFANLLFTEEDWPDLQVEVENLIRTCSQTNLNTNSITFLNGMMDFIRATSLTTPPTNSLTILGETARSYSEPDYKLPCYAGYITCTVDALGRVSPCYDTDTNESVRNKPLHEIWNSLPFQELREKVRNCKRDCWDTTHTELNVRSSTKGLINEWNQIWKDKHFYSD